METKNNTNANKSRKAIRIVISILVAIALWVYVDRGLSVEVTMKVNNVPVEFSGEDTTLADKNLMLLSGYDTTIDLVLKGPRSELFKLDKSKVRIVADTSSIQETGQQTLTYQVYYQDDIQRSKISVDHASAYSVTVTVGEMDSKTVPIHCDIVGSTATGFTAGELTLDPAELNLRGQRDDLLNIAYAKVTLSVDNASETVSQALDYQLYDADDQLIEDRKNLHATVEQVQVTLPVNVEKELPLLVNFVESAGARKTNLEYTITPSSVTVSGAAEILKNVDAITLDTLELADLTGAATYRYPIMLPEGCENLSGVTRATMTIRFKDMTSASVNAVNFACENVPDGKTVNVLTTELPVSLRGTAADVESVTPENVVVVADLTDVNDASGSYTVPARVEISGADVGVLGDYQVRVTITEDTGEPDGPHGDAADPQPAG